MQATQNPQVQFRRINGRVVPIRIKEGGPSQKPDLTAERKARQLTQKINKDGIFGSKYLNPQTIGISVLAGLGVAGGLKGTTMVIKKAGSKLYGPKGFSGIGRYLNNMSNLRNKAATQAYKLNQEAKVAIKNLDNFAQLPKNIFSYEKEGDLLRKASFLSKQADFKRQQAIKLSQTIKRVERQTGYNYTKPVVDFWKNNEAKIYAGVGTAGALTAYAEQTMGKKRK